MRQKEEREQDDIVLNGTFDQDLAVLLLECLREFRKRWFAIEYLLAVRVRDVRKYRGGVIRQEDTRSVQGIKRKGILYELQRDTFISDVKNQ